MAAHRLRILHLSDLHAEEPAKDAAALARSRVLGAGWAENLARIAAAGPIDLVCLTGDVAHAGRDGDYAAATAFVDDLLARVGVGRDRLFVVPGNHDVQRGVARGAWEALRHLAAADEDALSRWMAGADAPPGADAAHRGALQKRLTAYRRWVRADLGRPGLVPGPRALHPRLGFRETLAVRDLPFPVHVLGLDSAWLAGADGDARDLRLTHAQVHRLATDDGERLAGFRLALVHHPVAALADGERCLRDLAEHTDLLLHGSLHAAEVHAFERVPPMLAAGRLDGDLRAPNAVQVIDVGVDDAGRLLDLDVWVRRWSDPAGWADDDTLYAGSAGGHVCWPLRDATEVTGAPDVSDAPEAPVDEAPIDEAPIDEAPIDEAPLTDEAPSERVTLDLRALPAPELGAVGAALAKALGLPWTGPETWVRMLARLLRRRARVEMRHAGTVAVAMMLSKLVARLPGCAIEARRG